MQFNLIFRLYGVCRERLFELRGEHPRERLVVVNRAACRDVDVADIDAALCPLALLRLARGDDSLALVKNRPVSVIGNSADAGGGKAILSFF